MSVFLSIAAAVVVASAHQPQAQPDVLPLWVATLISRQPARSMTAVEESIYQGHRAFVVMPGDRAPDSGNEHVLYSEDGQVICEFGGLAGHVTAGSCDLDAIKFVRVLFPQVKR